MANSKVHCATRYKYFCFKILSYFLVIFFNLLKKGNCLFAFWELKEFKDYSKVIFIGMYFQTCK